MDKKMTMGAVFIGAGLFLILLGKNDWTENSSLAGFLMAIMGLMLFVL